VPVLQKVVLSAGPSSRNSFSLGDFGSYTPLSYEFHVDAPLCDSDEDDDISSPTFAYASCHGTNISMDTPEDVSIVPSPFTPLASLGELSRVMNKKVMLLCIIMSDLNGMIVMLMMRSV